MGCLRVTWEPEELEHARVQYEAMRADDLPAEWVDEADLPAIVRRPGRVGVFSPPDATMHPARWVRAFSRAIEARGVRIFEHSPVPEPLEAARNGGFAVRAGGGTVHAQRVVVAADGALPQLVPVLRARACAPSGCTWSRPRPSPSASCRARSAPAGATSTCSSGPTAASPLGGFSDHDGERAADSYTTAEQASPAIHARLERFLRDDLGVEAPVTHRWIGLVGYSRDERPFAGAVPRHDGLFVAGGYNGTGNLNGFTAGRVVSELLATGQSADARLYDSARPLVTA